MEVIGYHCMWIKMRVSILIVSFSLLLCSCFYGSMKGFSSGYDSFKQTNSVVFIDKSFDEHYQFDNRNIYALNAITLKNELKKSNKALVYFWSANCHSNVCISPINLQSVCSDRNVELFLIVEYYDEKINEFSNTLKKPVFSINHFFYKTNYVDSYRKKFTTELTGISDNSNDIYNRYFYFENGNFIKSMKKPEF